MFTRWTSHLNTEEAKEKFRLQVHAAKLVLDRLKAMLEDDLKGLDNAETDTRSYASPNWDYLQAHRNGNRQAYQTLIKVVDLDQQNGTINDHKPTGTI